MSRRTLRFVDDPAHAPAADPATDIVVLDTSWTPRPDDRPDVVSVRPLLTAVLRRADVIDGSLAVLDAWAESAHLADRFVADDVTWWYRVRMMVRWDIHELMLWRLVLDELGPPGRYDEIVVPPSRPAIAAAARATSRAANAPRVEVSRTGSGGPAGGIGWIRRRALRLDGPRLRPWLRRARNVARWRPSVARRDALLAARIEDLSAEPGGVLAVASARFFQVLRSDGRDRFADPHLDLVLDRLAAEGRPVVTVGLALDQRVEADWRRVAADDRLLPSSLLTRRWSAGGDDAIDSSEVAAGLADLGRIPLEVEGWDLGPAVAAIVSGFGGRWLDGQRRGIRRAERLMDELQPGVLFIDHEGVRTSWLAAARRLGVPIVAVQHGVIYPDNPEYCHPLHPALVRPDMTCLFGSYERDLLVERGGYDPASVVVTGSSRADPRTAERAPDPGERDQVRRELGVADGRRMLVVSVAHNPIAGQLHSAEMVGRLLGGPLPGIHVVIKLHPQDRTQGPFAALLRGLAQAGGSPAPDLTVVRDVDLYRLLRSADAHLGQYSTVLTDAVVAGTPNMIAAGLASSDQLGYVAARVAVPVESVDDVCAFMRDPRPADPADRSRFLEAHFAPGDATGRIVEAIHDVEAAHAVEATARRTVDERR